MSKNKISRKGFGSGFILPNKERVNPNEYFMCRVCKHFTMRKSIAHHFRTKIHNQSVIDRHNEKYWNKNYCFDLKKK